MFKQANKYLNRTAAQQTIHFKNASLQTKNEKTRFGISKDLPAVDDSFENRHQTQHIIGSPLWETITAGAHGLKNVSEVTAIAKAADSFPLPSQWDVTLFYISLYDFKEALETHNRQYSMVYPGFFLYRVAKIMQQTKVVASPKQWEQLTQRMIKLGFVMMQENPGTKKYAQIAPELKRLQKGLAKIVAQNDAARTEATVPSTENQAGWIMRRFLISEATAVLTQKTPWHDPNVTSQDALLGVKESAHTRLRSLVQLLQRSWPSAAFREEHVAFLESSNLLLEMANQLGGVCPPEVDSPPCIELLTQWKQSAASYLAALDTWIADTEGPNKAAPIHIQRSAQMASDYIGLHDFDKALQAVLDAPLETFFEHHSGPHDDDAADHSDHGGRIEWLQDILKDLTDEENKRVTTAMKEQYGESIDVMIEVLDSIHAPQIARLSKLFETVEFSHAIEGRDIEHLVAGYRSALQEMISKMHEIIEGPWTVKDLVQLLIIVDEAHEEGQHGLSRTMDGRNGENGTSEGDDSDHDEDHHGHSHR